MSSTYCRWWLSTYLISEFSTTFLKARYSQKSCLGLSLLQQEGHTLEFEHWYSHSSHVALHLIFVDICWWIEGKWYHCETRIFFQKHKKKPNKKNDQKHMFSRQSVTFYSTLLLLLLLLFVHFGMKKSPDGFCIWARAFDLKGFWIHKLSASQRSHGRSLPRGVG